MNAPYIEDTSSISNPMQVLLIALNYTIVGYNESSHDTGTRLTVKKLGETTPNSINITMNIDGSTPKPTGNFKTIPIDTMYYGDDTKPPNTKHNHRNMMDPSLKVKMEMMINPVHDNTTKSTNPTMNIDVCREECCSRYGINFIECITHTFNVDSMAIDDIMHGCYFVEGKYSETMTNKEKRFLLYWWFATNIYLVCGRHNRC